MHRNGKAGYLGNKRSVFVFTMCTRRTVVEVSEGLERKSRMLFISFAIKNQI